MDNNYKKSYDVYSMDHNELASLIVSEDFKELTNNEAFIVIKRHCEYTWGVCI